MGKIKFKLSVKEDWIHLTGSMTTDDVLEWISKEVRKGNFSGSKNIEP